MIHEGPYKKLKEDPTTKYALAVEKVCNEFITKGKLTILEGTRFNIKNPRSPIIYGAPKIHKPNVPLRPMVDFRYSPTYNLASYISNILQKVAANHEFTVKNSIQMVNSLKNIKMRPGDTKVSFDVVSLFTKVPKEETLEYIKQRLTDFDDLDNWTKLNTDEIMELLNICICSTYFKFNDQFFKQLEGTAMGSPISPIFAELFLQKLENNLIKNNRNIIVWRRYVDDVSTL
jgi:hypothetical protein